MPLFASHYEILRGVSSTSRRPCDAQPSREPIRVAFLLDEAAFVAKGLIAHHKTVFLEDKTHDWDWRDGVFYYYGRAIDPEETGTIVAIHAQSDQPQGGMDTSGNPASACIETNPAIGGLTAIEITSSVLENTPPRKGTS